MVKGLSAQAKISKQKKLLVCLISVIAFLFVVSVPTRMVDAAPGYLPLVDDPPPGDLFAPVVETIRDFVIGLIRFLVFLGGVVFLVSVVLGASRGSLGVAIGNSLQASQGVVTALMAVAAFVFLLVAVPVADSIINTLADKVMSSANIDDMQSIVQEIPDGELSSASLDAINFLDIPELQEAITNIAISVVRAAIGIGTIAFVIGIVLGALDTQIGTLLGGGQMASRGMMRAISAVGAVIFLFVSYPLADALLRGLVPRILTGISINLPF